MIINRSFNVAFLLSVAQQKSEKLFLFFHELDQAVSDPIKIVGVESITFRHNAQQRQRDRRTDRIVLAYVALCNSVAR